MMIKKKTYHPKFSMNKELIKVLFILETATSPPTIGKYIIKGSKLISNENKGCRYNALKIHLLFIGTYRAVSMMVGILARNNQISEDSTLCS